MFHFPGCPPTELWIHSVVTGHYPSRVPPFGNLRINAYLRLPPAYRSLSRPSSAISAMASTLRSCSLDLASSRQLLLPKTLESSNQQRLFVVCFFPVQFSRCVPQAKRLLDSKYQLIVDPSKRYRNQSFCLSDSTPACLLTIFSTPCVVVASPCEACRSFRLPATDVTQLST